MKRRYNNILETVGHTPVVKINKLAPEGVNLYVKVEAFNPMGSVKDRLALGIIEAAERDGSLKPGQTVIEATSGNTGIGLAMVCAIKGYPLVVTMAESFSVERRKLMRFLGAKVILTPAAAKGSGMLDKAVELSKKHGWFLCRQFENPANPDIHSKTTAPEILEAFSDTILNYWVTGFGTAGTLKGVARVLKEKSPKTKIIVCEPDNSPLLSTGIAQNRKADGSIAESHPGFRPHLMQGWSPDFIPMIAEETLKDNLIDGFIPINGENALHASKQLAQQEGIFCGISAGATLVGGLKIAKEAPKGTNILCMLPDTGERYLSTPLFAGITEAMTAEEEEISKSTPNFRFDKPAAAAPAAVPQTTNAALDEKASAFVEETLKDKAKPVVLFALEWCEFCWSVKNLFAANRIDYRAVDLDSVAYQKGDMGGKIRKVLAVKSGSVTIPQVFIAGQFIGGCTETFDAYKDGRLRKLLDQNRVAYDQSVKIDPYTLLPGWLQPR